MFHQLTASLVASQPYKDKKRIGCGIFYSGSYRADDLHEIDRKVSATPQFESSAAHVHTAYSQSLVGPLV